MRVDEDFDGLEVWLTEGGHDAVGRLLRHRADPAARHKAIRDSLLRFLYGSGLAGEDHVADEAVFQSACGSFYLDPFRFAELEAAKDWLISERLVSESGSWGPLPVITPAGERLVRGGRSVMDAVGPAAGSTYSTTVTNSTGVNVAQGSPGATQSVTLSADEVVEVDQLLAAVRALFSGSDTSTAEVAEVTGLTGELELAARGSTPSRQRVRQLVSRLAGAVGNAAAQAMASALVGPVIQIAENLARALGV